MKKEQKEQGKSKLLSFHFLEQLPGRSFKLLEVSIHALRFFSHSIGLVLLGLLKHGNQLFFHFVQRTHFSKIRGSLECFSMM